MDQGSDQQGQAEGDPWVRRDRRRDRFSLLAHLWSLTSLPRIRACRRTRVSIEAGVQVVLNGDVAHLRGIQSCGSISSCPVCSPTIRHGRALEIEQAALAHLEQGGGLEFATFTLPHDLGDDLAPMLSAVSLGFSTVIGGGAWIKDRADFGVVGTIRSLEVTLGPAGWHPHLHVLIFTEAPLSAAGRQRLRDRLHGRWCRSVQRSGYRSPSEAHGTRVLPVVWRGDLARYLAKVEDEHGAQRGVGNELARHDLKTGRRHGRTPFQLLDDTRTGDASDLARWWEYERGMKGRQVITWSKGLKARFLVEDVEDEEIVEAEVGGDVVADIANSEWAAFRKVAGRMTPTLLTATELHGAAGAYEVLALVLARDEGPPLTTDLRTRLVLQSDSIPLR